MQLVGGAPVELAIAGERDDVGAGLRERLADVAGLDPSEAFDILQYAVAKSSQQPAALEGGHVTPCPFESGAGGSHGSVDIGLPATGDRREDLAGRGIDYIERLAGACVDEGAADEMFRGRKRGGDVVRHWGTFQSMAGGLGLPRSMSQERPDVRNRRVARWRPGVRGVFDR